MKIPTKVHLVFTISITSSTSVFAERSIECLMDVVVIPSERYDQPVTKHTSIKNDSWPMLLVGIEIQDSKAAYRSIKIKSHQKYCLGLIGQRKDAYLSGPHDQHNLKIHLGDHLKLRNIHSSGKNYPYWPEFYYQVKSE